MIYEPWITNLVRGEGPFKLTREIIVVVFNHNHNAQAIRLKEEFSRYFHTQLVDSGSTFGSAMERTPFDHCLANVYYGGLLTKARELAQSFKFVFVIASDVVVPDVDKLARRMTEVIHNSRFGSYSPSSTGSSHPHCENQGTGGLREVSFLEGYCFLCNTHALNWLCREMENNDLGWGYDIALGYYNFIRSRSNLVDDSLKIIHKKGAGYNPWEAKEKMIRWMNKRGIPLDYPKYFHSTESFGTLGKKLSHLSYRLNRRIFKHRYQEFIFSLTTFLLN